MYINLQLCTIIIMLNLFIYKVLNYNKKIIYNLLIVSNIF